MDGIESNKSSLPVNDNDKMDTTKIKSEKDNNAPAKKQKRPRKEQSKEFEKIPTGQAGVKNNNDRASKKLAKSETDSDNDTKI